MSTGKLTLVIVARREDTIFHKIGSPVPQVIINTKPLQNKA